MIDGVEVLMFVGVIDIDFGFSLLINMLLIWWLVFVVGELVEICIVWLCFFGFDIVCGE